MASLSPEERRALEYWTGIQGDRSGVIIGKLRQINELDEEEQKNLLMICKPSGRDIWIEQLRKCRLARSRVEELKRTSAGLSGKKLVKLERKLEKARKELEKYKSRVVPAVERAKALGIALPEEEE